MDNFLIGNKLYELRKASGLSQDELAFKLEVSRQAVSKWERGEALPDAENLIKLSKLYQVSLDEIVGNDINTSTKCDNEPDINTLEEFDDDDEPDDEMDENKESSLISKLLINIPFPLAITIAFLIWGFVYDSWGIAWTLFMTVPIYYSVIEAIIIKRVSAFAYPILITFIYLLLGICAGLWHPLWLIYLTVPIYYIIADTIDKHIKK